MYSGLCVVLFGHEPDKHGDNMLTFSFAARKYVHAY